MSEEKQADEQVPAPDAKQENASAMEELLKQTPPHIPQIGDLVEGVVTAVSKSEVHIDIDGYTSGVIRGYELMDESGEYERIKVGDTVQATLLELENENREMELSFRHAGHKKAWDSLDELLGKGTIVDARITDANKGGLMAMIGNVEGFLPVSQLTTKHYPRVEGGEKRKILERLQSYTGDTFRVKVIDVNERENKLIVSEKAAYEEEHKKRLEAYSVSDVVEGTVTGVVNFGAFVEFDEGLEGLIHISELAWQRIDDPHHIVKVGDHVKAKIISLDQNRISLSMKQLSEDPWQKAVEKYSMGQVVKGTVTKINPYGAFVELDKDIHGLAHISELTDRKIATPADVVKVGEDQEFKIISIDPAQHRLGLSLRKVNEPEEKAEKQEEKSDPPEQETSNDAAKDKEAVKDKGAVKKEPEAKKEEKEEEK